MAPIMIDSPELEGVGVLLPLNEIDTMENEVVVPSNDFEKGCRVGVQVMFDEVLAVALGCVFGCPCYGRIKGGPSFGVATC